MDPTNDEAKSHTLSRPASLPPLRLHIARVVVAYEVVEMPERCPQCGVQFWDDPRGARNLKEVNLADTSFCGSLPCRNMFEPDPETRVEEPETFFFPYRYECARCGEPIAGDDVVVAQTAEAVEDPAPEVRRGRSLPACDGLW